MLSRTASVTIAMVVSSAGAIVATMACVIGALVVKALLASEKWRGMSDREIAREAAVGYTLVAKLRKTSNQLPAAGSSTTTLGKDGKHYPARRMPKQPPHPLIAAGLVGAFPATTEKSLSQLFGIFHICGI